MAKGKVNFGNVSSQLTFVPPKVDMKGQEVTPKMKLAINKALVKGVQKGMTYVEAALRPALNASMASQWSWGVGKAGAPSRDIIDTGALRDSLKLKTTFLQTKTKLDITYTQRYAAFVHYGGYIQHYGNKKASAVYIPGRPWVTAVLEGTHGQPKLDYATPFNAGIQEAWAAQFG